MFQDLCVCYACILGALFFECIFAEGHYCVEIACVVVHHLRSAEIQILFIIAEDRNLSSGK